MIFPMRLKELRNNRNVTQKEIADLLNISPSTVGMYEQGRREPDYITLEKIADYFNVTIDYLLGRTDNPNGYDFKHILETYSTNLEEFLKHQDIPLDLIQLLKEAKSLTPGQRELLTSFLKTLKHDDQQKDESKAGQNSIYETQAAHRIDDPVEKLPDDAQKSLDAFKEHMLKEHNKL